MVFAGEVGLDGVVERYVLPTARSTYVVAPAPDRCGLELVAWGQEFPEPQPMNWEAAADSRGLEFSALGTRQLRGSELVVDHGDGWVGARLVLGAVTRDQDGTRSRLVAELVDTDATLAVRTELTTSTDHDVVAKRARLTNTGEAPLHLDRLFSGAFALPVTGAVDVDYQAGTHMRENQQHRVSLAAGEFSIGSRQGFTSHTYVPGIELSGDPSWPAGSGYGVALAWCGSWRLLVDRHPLADRVRVAAGFGDGSTRVLLGPGEAVTTPWLLGVYADDARDLPQRWHEYQRAELLRPLPPERRPVLYNSWYATEFDVRPEHQMALADAAAALGCEAFVVDDGWFAGRVDDHAGLGDWTPDPEKFPDGLDPLIEHVERLGMTFGLWVEPEAVNPDSDLYRAHPDWIYRAGGRPLITMRHEYLLDFGRPDVVAWTKDWLRTLLTWHRIGYLKWDMNRAVSDGGRPGDPHGRAWSIQHALGYLDVMTMLREEFPHVTVEACASGGGRVDHLVLAHSDVVWASDQTGPHDRLLIQDGFLRCYAPSVMSSWVTDMADQHEIEGASLAFRVVVAMAGVLGLGADLLAWDDDERALVAQLVTIYRQVRDTIRDGRVDRLGHPHDPVYAVQYTRADEVVVLCYGHLDAPAGSCRIPLRGLDPSATYALGDRTWSGAELMDPGLPVDWMLALDADVLVVHRHATPDEG